jgi:hypothetical protein
MSKATNKFTLLLTIFPLIAGLALTSLGIIDLNTASETTEPKPNKAYGVLTYSSEKCEEISGQIILQDINLKEDVTNIKIDSNFYLAPPRDTPYEVIFGFQVPGISDQPNFNIKGADKETGTIEITALEEKILTYKAEGCSLIYLRFIAQPNIKYYRVVAQSNFSGLVSKQSFSTYEVSIPISRTDSNLLTKSGLSVTSLKVEWGCSMFAPEGTELKWAIPYPENREIWLPTNVDDISSEGFTSFSWVARDRGFDPSDTDVRSDIISVLFDVSAESRIQGRLLFDSGLYMGIGIGLVISGLPELLRVYSRKRAVHGVEES